MKKLLIALAAVMITVASYGQGQVVFANKVGTAVDAPVLITGTQDGPGPNWTSQLFLQGANGSLTALTPTATFRPRGTSGAGLTADRYWVTPSTPVDVAVTPGTDANFVVRAWLTSLGSFDAAKASGGGFGESAAFAVTVGGGTLPPANLVNLKTFNVVPVPEPSIIALGVLGASALLLRRRK